MRKETIDSLFRRVINDPSGSIAVKFDLHIHTPASKDFVTSEKMSSEEAYLNILDQAIDNEIRIIAITDHNTFDGYNTIKELLKDNETRKKYKELLVLCGIEITCFSKHLLAIFPPEMTSERQKEFLKEIGLTSDNQDSESPMADIYGPSILIDKVWNYGGFSILAHADSNSGFLQHLCNNSESKNDFNFTGRSLVKILTSNHLLGIQVNNTVNIKKIENSLNNPIYIRKSGKLSFLKFSDLHGNVEKGIYIGKSGKQIGKDFSLAKLSTISFNSIKLALYDSEMRIIDEKNESSYPQIIGCAIKSRVLRDLKDREYCVFHFNPEMNCIIGGRGTGKSTLLEIIQSVLLQENIKNKISDVRNRYTSAIIYIKNNEKVYAIVNEPKSHFDDYTKENIYENCIGLFIKKNEYFSSDLNFEDFESLTTIIKEGYKQHKLYDYTKNPNLILDIVDDFLRWEKPKEYKNLISQINHNKEDLKNTLYDIENRRNERTFVDFIRDNNLQKIISEKHNLIEREIKKLQEYRHEIINKLNKMLKGKMELYLGEQIEQKDYNYLIDIFPSEVKKVAHEYAEFRIIIRDIMTKVCGLSNMGNCFNFFIWLLEDNVDKVINEYKLEKYKDYLLLIKDTIYPDCVLMFMEPQISLHYNINLDIEGAGEHFEFNTNISLGQNAVALLLLILNAAYDIGDNRPLIMDQPEDDLDNTYIYSTLVKEFRKSKTKRQILISTHNPNIPVGADAENILILKYNGQFGYLAESGSIDDPKISNLVKDILEGGEKAIQNRDMKYSNI